MATTQPTTPADEMDMRALMSDTMARLGVKSTPLAVTPPAAPDDTPAQPTTPPMSRQEQLIGAALGIVLLIILSIVWSRWQVPAATGSTPAPTVASVSTAAPATAPPVPMLNAYAAPNEAPRWQIEATRAITPTAHYGDGWIQADVAGSGLIWLRAADVPALAIVGLDLAPKPTERPAAVLPRATAEPAAPPCAEAGVDGKMVKVCDYAELSELEARAKAQWIEQYGGNIGVVSTPSPQVRTP